RLPGRRQEWHAGRATDLARDARQRRLQPAADAALDRYLSDPPRRPRAGDLRGGRPRPGGRRERQPTLRLRPCRRPPSEPGRAAEDVPARWPALDRLRRPLRLRPAPPTGRSPRDRGPSASDGHTGPAVSRDAPIAP